MNAAFDLVIVGGGPAGAAAGIWALDNGLRVALLERRPFPRHRPGETLHPGVEPILRQLGVFDALEALKPIRPAAVLTIWSRRKRLIPYGADARGPWRGFQVLRSDLDSLLIRRFEALGGTLIQPAADVAPVTDAGRVRGIRAGALSLDAAAVIDASGTGGFLRRWLKIGVTRLSSRLVAHYGYRRGVFGDVPHLTATADGWNWCAEVAPGLIHWTRLSFLAGRSVTAPEELTHLEPAGRHGAADCTWRRLNRFAGPGYFITGDAAMVIDPASSNGVLRALMSGMMAAYAVKDIVRGRKRPEAAAQAYSDWLGAWFRHDTDQLRALYRELGVEGFFQPRDNPAAAIDGHSNGRA